MVADTAGPGFVSFMQAFISDLATMPKVSQQTHNVAFLPTAVEDVEASTTRPLPQPSFSPSVGSEINAAADFVIAEGSPIPHPS